MVQKVFYFKCEVCGEEFKERGNAEEHEELCRSIYGEEKEKEKYLSRTEAIVDATQKLIEKSK